MNTLKGRKRYLLLISFLSAFLIAMGGCEDNGNGKNGGGKKPKLVDTTKPRVTVTVPVDGATMVVTNGKITATFTEDMVPSTINGTTFTVYNDSLGASVVGTVMYAAVARTATFTPTAPLPDTSMFTATIKKEATDLAGNQLAGNQVALPAASDYVWTFSTGSATDTDPPTVTLNNPAEAEGGVCINKTVSATFSEPMDPATITTSTFTLAVTAGGASVPGVVAYDPLTDIATFNPTGNLADGTQYTATITTGVKDLAGNALVTANVTMFTTGSSTCTSPVALGAVAPFGGFGGGAGMTNMGTSTIINGDIGTTGVSTTMTGFHDSTGDGYTETGSNAGLVNGRIYTAPPPPVIFGPGGPFGGTAATFAIATAAASDALIAFNSISPGSLPGGASTALELGGTTVYPGIYTAAGGAFQVKVSDLVLDAQGDPNAVWVFQAASSLTIGPVGGPAVSVNLINGAQAKNVYWYVGTAARIENLCHMVGTILASAGVTISTAGEAGITTLDGRAVGLNASVTMVNTVINVPAP